jgi:starch phosphorylase
VPFRSDVPHGPALPDAAWCDEVLDPKALTVCFARRFATYKRATLLLTSVDQGLKDQLRAA